MKINSFMAIISVAIAALIGFGFFMANEGETYRILITIGSGLSLFVTLGGIIALSSPHGGTGNIRVVSGLFFAVLLVIHGIFSFITIKMAPYIIIVGLLMLIYILICYAITRALK